jgi:HlyD family secretion protein
MNNSDRTTTVADSPEAPTLRPSVNDEQMVALRRKRALRRTRARWLKRGTAVLVGLAVVGGIAYAWVPSPVAVDVGVARRETLQIYVEEDGRTRVRERYVVAAPLSGNLLRVELEPGDRVPAGATLARVLPPAPALLDERSRAEAEAHLAGTLAREGQSRSALARAEAARDLAVSQAERTRRLAQVDAATRVERERADAEERVAQEDMASAALQLRVAASEVRTARAALGLLLRGRGGSSSGARGAARDDDVVAVLAPAPGQVLRLLRESEGPVAAGTPLLELGEPSSVEVVVDVLSSDAARIRAGAPAWIEQWGGDQALPGRVLRVEPSAFTSISALGVEEQRVNVVIALERRPPALGDGFRVEARILTWEGNHVLSVPASAALRHGDGWAVYIIDEGRARLRPVQIGHRGRTDVEVTGGLADSTTVVLYPGDRVTDGARVEPR